MMSPDNCVGYQFDLQQLKVNAGRGIVDLCDDDPQRKWFVTRDNSRIWKSCVDTDATYLERRRGRGWRGI